MKRKFPLQNEILVIQISFWNYKGIHSKGNFFVQ